MPAQVSVSRLGPRATAYVQPDGGWFLNNAGWITGSERTVVVDTCATETRTRRLLDALAAHTATPRAPLVAALTHAHGDHTNGARLVTDAGGTVLATEAAAEVVASGPHTYPSVFACTTWGDISPPETTETITAPLRLDLGGTTAEVIPVTGPAHTDGDLVVWHPDDGVLFTGDLLSHGVVPLGLHGSLSGWLSTLDWLTGFDARWIVPGHGPVTPADQGLVPKVAEYLTWLLDTASRVQDPNDPRADREARARWPHWIDAERHVANLHVAHAEVHGYPLDTAGALKAMLAATGEETISLDL
ncbi:MBL fold metallo-hydrolase [Streptoalloteichus hindustanus]|uniref:Cyclase n=1 Tax=Streptoalloteichus hindustanus TaxID=2017 RepID=A0A1M5FDY1_STRHI|nr:MBL fold metallo-hydrolase [Streptoalloteichus hindustanus]SHF89649.1 cyclase [Streptoalloteichus hindustanus]